MSSFNANSQMYNVTTENELAEVLSHYDSEFIFSIIDEAMKYRFRAVPIISLSNVIGAWEQNFKAIIAQYGSESTREVMRVRNETYQEVIDIICKEFSLSFTIDDTVDLYSAAFYLYDFMVCKFTDNMTTFLANFIYKERSSLYESLGLVDYKKNKDSSTIYSKKVYKDSKLAIINANIDSVIDSICEIDMPFANILSNIYGTNSELKKFIFNIVSAEHDFFTSAYIPVIKSEIRPEIITAVRFKLQELAMTHDQTVSSTDVLNPNA